MEGWSLIRGMPEDRAQVLALYGACSALPGCTWSLDYPNGETFDDDIAHGWLYCLWEGGQIIAAVSVGALGEHVDDGVPWTAARNLWEFARLGVRPDRGGQGIGAYLVGHVVSLTCEGGGDALRILVSPGNPPALALYRRAGFRTVAEVDRFDHHWLCQELNPLPKLSEAIE